MTMAYTAVAATIISAGLTAYSAYSAGENAKEQADYQKKVAENNNLMLERQQIENANVAATQAADKRTDTLRMMSRQSAAAAASGVQTGTGSIGKIQDETSQTGALDMLRILNNAQRGNQQLQTQQMNNTAGAQLAQMQADNVSNQSTLSMIGSGLNLSSNLATNYNWKNFNSEGGWKIGFKGDK